jgi:transcriptional regulator with XRE-family HTH domain
MRGSFAKKLGVSRSTVNKWFSEPPRTPDARHLLAMAQEDRLSLDWLLLGEGSRLRPVETESESTAERFRAMLAAELLRTGASEHEVASVLGTADEMRGAVVAYLRQRLVNHRREAGELVSRRR